MPDNRMVLLVNNAPISCGECIAFSSWWVECQATKKRLRGSLERPDWCPLVPVAEFVEREMQK